MTIRPYIALFGKEVRQLLPLIFALFVLNGVGLLDAFAGGSPDEMTWSELSILLNVQLGQNSVMIYFIIGLVAAYILLPPEQDQRTLEFLWALPIRRWQVFAVKLGSAFTVLCSLVLIDHLLAWWVQSFHSNSITSSQFSWNIWWLEIAMLSGLCAIALGYGVFASFFRTFGVLALVLFWTVTSFLEFQNPSLSYLNVTNLLTVEHRGSEIILPENAWWLHSGIAVVCVILACLLWVGHAEAFVRFGERIRRGVAARVGGVLLGIVAVVLLLGFAVSQFGLDSVDDDLASNRVSETIETNHYTLEYYAEDRERVQLFARDVDDLFNRTRVQLGASAGAKIVADLTDASDDHLGIAGWQKLRMKRSALYDLNRRAHVFVHETAHVLAAQVADRRLQEHASDAAFFSEGIAEWVSFEVLGLAAEREALELLAATAWHRFDLDFADIVYAASFRTRFDENLIYALGVAWVSTLAQTCGDNAPGAALRAMARSGAPQQLSGSRFWQDTLQAIGCDLSTVNGRFAINMLAMEDASRQIPQLITGVNAGERNIDFTLRLEGPRAENQYRVTVRLRDSALVAPGAVITRTQLISADEQIELSVFKERLSGERFQYQVGIEFLPGQRPFFGRWIDEG